MDDMIVKYKDREKNTNHLESIFEEVGKHAMRLNLKNATLEYDLESY